MSEFQTPQTNPEKKTSTESNSGKKMMVNLDGQAFKEFFEKFLNYNYGQMLLRDREHLFGMIHSEKELESQIQFFALYSLLFSAIYGGILGSYAGGLQILAGACKVPILLFGTLILCLPSLYIFNILLGSKLSFKQTLTILLVSTYLMSMLLASLSPIVFFFIMTTGAKMFISLLNLIVFTISGLFSLDLLWKGMRYLTEKSGYEPNIRVIKVWSIIYAVVGSQLSWGLRPYIGDINHFALFRDIEGNFYIAVVKLVKNFIMGLL